MGFSRSSLGLIPSLIQYIKNWSNSQCPNLRTRNNNSLIKLWRKAVCSMRSLTEGQLNFESLNTTPTYSLKLPQNTAHSHLLLCKMEKCSHNKFPYVTDSSHPAHLIGNSVPFKNDFTYGHQLCFQTRFNNDFIWAHFFRFHHALH